MTKVWYRAIGDSKPTFLTPADDPTDRPDEHFVLSDVVIDNHIEVYEIVWDGSNPTVIRLVDADIIIVNKLLLRARELQKTVIAESWLAAPTQGLLSSLGYKVNATRVDKDNVRSLLDYCLAKGLPGIDTFRIYDNTTVAVTIDDLQVIHNEIVEFGLGLYQYKWAKGAAIDAAPDEATVKAITWESVE